MAIEEFPASNDKNVNAIPWNTNKTFGDPNLSMLKQNTPYSYVK